MLFSKKTQTTCSFQIGTKNPTKKKFIVGPSFFTSWTIANHKCTRAHVQDKKSIYLSIYLSIWKPFWKRVYIYIHPFSKRFYIYTRFQKGFHIERYIEIYDTYITEHYGATIKVVSYCYFRELVVSQRNSPIFYMKTRLDIKPKIMAQHNVIYIEAWYARDIPLELACTRHEIDISISLANQFK